MRYVEGGVTDEVASDITNVSNIEIGLVLQIDIVVILSLESDVSSLSTLLFK